MKQTAVEWLMQELKPIDITYKEIFEQAKEMEKEQMRALYAMFLVNTKTMELYDFDEWYNETFQNK